jgi:hypothetical protein
MHKVSAVSVFFSSFSDDGIASAFAPPLSNHQLKDKEIQKRRLF